MTSRIKDMRVLFICKERLNSYKNSVGLVNSALFVANKLNELEIQAKVVTVVDANAIDREVYNYRPTHVIIEALWVTPAKFAVLLNKYPAISWITRIHSKAAFLSNEGIALDWMVKYRDELSTNYTNFYLSANNEEFCNDLNHTLDLGCIFLPNIYDPSYVENVDLPPRVTKPGVLNIGCLPANSMVQTDIGLKPIKWIVDNKYNGKVLSLSDGGTFEWNKITNHWARDNKLFNKKWVSVQIPGSSKKRLLCTEDHPCAVIDDPLNPKVKFVEAKHIKGKYSVRSPRKIKSKYHNENPLYNQEQLSVIIGSLLGDGNIGHTNDFSVTHSSNQKDYIEFKQSILSGTIGLQKCLDRTINGKLVLASTAYRLQCPTNVQISYLKDLAYPYGDKKSVVRILPHINAISLAFWYMDDGNLAGKKHDSVTLNTQGFTLTDNIEICKWFKDKWDIAAYVYKFEREGKKNHVIKIRRDGQDRFFELISQYVCKSMNYKLPPKFWGYKKYAFNNIPLSFSAAYVVDVVPSKRYNEKNHSKLYDIEVENNHNFVANNTVVHNCFGAIRPMKNTLVQGIAAIIYGNKEDIKIRFHVNAGRVEQNGASHLRNLEELFAGTGRHELIKHDWFTHDDFIALISTMDLGMQVSFSETFNIVTADMVSLGIPVVVSDEIDWVTPIFQADTASTEDIVDTMKVSLTFGKVGAWLNYHRLENYSKKATAQWLKILKEY